MAMICRPLGGIFFLQGDQSVFVRLGHRAVIAGEDHDDDLGLFEFGQIMLFVIGADQVAPGRCSVANAQRLVELAGIRDRGESNERQGDEREDANGHERTGGRSGRAMRKVSVKDSASL